MSKSVLILPNSHLGCRVVLASAEGNHLVGEVAADPAPLTQTIHALVGDLDRRVHRLKAGLKVETLPNCAPYPPLSLMSNPREAMTEAWGEARALFRVPFVLAGVPCATVTALVLAIRDKDWRDQIVLSLNPGSEDGKSLLKQAAESKTPVVTLLPTPMDDSATPDKVRSVALDLVSTITDGIPVRMMCAEDRASFERVLNSGTDAPVDVIIRKGGALVAEVSGYLSLMEDGRYRVKGPMENLPPAVRKIDPGVTVDVRGGYKFDPDNLEHDTVLSVHFHQLPSAQRFSREWVS